MTSSLFRRILFGFDQGTDCIYECRRCGTTVDGYNDDCPYCGPTNIVEYELS